MDDGCNTRINETQRIIVIPEDRLQTIDFQTKFLEFTTYAESPII